MLRSAHQPDTQQIRQCHVKHSNREEIYDSERYRGGREREREGEGEGETWGAMK